MNKIIIQNLGFECKLAESLNSGETLVGNHWPELISGLESFES